MVITPQMHKPPENPEQLITHAHIIVSVARVRLVRRTHRTSRIDCVQLLRPWNRVPNMINMYLLRLPPLERYYCLAQHTAHSSQYNPSGRVKRQLKQTTKQTNTRH